MIHRKILRTFSLLRCHRRHHRRSILLRHQFRHVIQLGRERFTTNFNPFPFRIDGNDVKVVILSGSQYTTRIQSLDEALLGIGAVANGTDRRAARKTDLIIIEGSVDDVSSGSGIRIL